MLPTFINDLTDEYIIRKFLKDSGRNSKPNNNRYNIYSNSKTIDFSDDNWKSKIKYYNYRKKGYFQRKCYIKESGAYDSSYNNKKKKNNSKRKNNDNSYFYNINGKFMLMLIGFNNVIKRLIAYII